MVDYGMIWSVVVLVVEGVRGVIAIESPTKKSKKICTNAGHHTLMDEGAR
jgi:hypothetical protein